MSLVQHVCLECSNIFQNNLNIAICPTCLEREKKNHDKGIRSKYTTVFLYLSGKVF